MTTITAVPAGKLHNGQPVTRRVTYVLTRETFEPWTPGTVRIFYRHPHGSVPTVVLADSIQQVP